MPNKIHYDFFFFFSLFGRAKETGDVHARKVLAEAVLCSAPWSTAMDFDR